MSKNGWIGVDLDGTLAEYTEWKSFEHIGEPIPEMVNRVKKWLAAGRDVRIFTARVDGGEVALSMGNPAGEQFRDVSRVTELIQDWCMEHIGARLPVTCRKDYGMVELWDDRAVQVIPNTGIPVAANAYKYRLNAEAAEESSAAAWKVLAWLTTALKQDSGLVLDTSGDHICAYIDEDDNRLRLLGKGDTLYDCILQAMRNMEDI